MQTQVSFKIGIAHFANAVGDGAVSIEADKELGPPQHVDLIEHAVGGYAHAFHSRKVCVGKSEIHRTNPMSVKLYQQLINHAEAAAVAPLGDDFLGLHKNLNLRL
jgi:hypothetical protein